MSKYQLVKGLKENQALRKSFNELAEATFEINFEKWYQEGYWGDNYIPYALVADGQVVANASITKSELIYGEKSYQVIQVGTVMTYSDYRNQGLSKKLMAEIIGDYQGKVDFIYLFANETVLDFYPKFGFNRVNEWTTKLNINKISEFKTGLKQVSFEEVKSELEEKNQQRNNKHLVTYLVDEPNLSLFYYSTVFTDNCYFIEELETYVCFIIEEGELHLFDVLSEKEVDILAVLSYLPLKKIKEVYAYFQLDKDNPAVLSCLEERLDDDALFVLGIDSHQLSPIKFPIFNHA